MDGQAPVRALAERLGCDLDEHHETTAGGYLSEQLARVPTAGETVRCHGWRVEILSVEETRIASLAVLLDRESAAPE
jgi:CBS domain containing-hemolysin-like protein